MYPEYILEYKTDKKRKKYESFAQDLMIGALFIVIITEFAYIHWVCN